MPRAPALVLGVAGVLLTAGLTAMVSLGGSLGAWLSLGAGAAAAAIGFGLTTRWARERIPGLRTFAMELARERDACLTLRSELKRQRSAKELEPWATWRDRILEWDRPFWKLLERRLPDLWRVYRREHAEIVDDYGDGDWSREMLLLLEARWQLIKRLSEREHAAGV